MTQFVASARMPCCRKAAWFRGSSFLFLPPSGNPLHAKNKAIFCCHVMLFIGVSSASDNLGLIKKENTHLSQLHFFS